MSLKVHAFTVGWLTMSMKAMLAGEEGKLKVPIPCYLIEHPKGLVLFDTGLHCDVATDPAGRLGKLVKYYVIDYNPGEDVVSRLAALGRRPQDVTFIVNSHLHFDHAGGNATIPDATVVVQRKELEAARDPDLAAKVGIERKDWDHGHKLLAVDGEHDLFGDGSVVCLPTHGHTPGHQSLKVKLPAGEIVLCGDACYLKRTLDEMRLPLIVYDAEAMRRSLEALARLRQAGARMFYGHDPEFWKTVPQAPAAIL